MTELFMETALVDSVIYNTFNTNGEIIKTLVGAIKDSTVINANYIDEQLLQIKRLRISPLSDKILDSYDNGDVVLLYSNVKKIPSFFPFFVTKTNGRITAYVFLNNYGKFSKVKTNGNQMQLNIPLKDLYALMEGATVARLYATNPIMFTRDYGLMKTCCEVYVGIFNRIFDREYALVMDKEAHDKVSFTVAKFFLERVWGCENQDVVTSYARNHTMYIAPNFVNALNDDYNNANIERVDDLINFLKELTPRLRSLNMRYFMQCYINNYKPSSLFGMEVLPYFLYTIQTTMTGSFLVNQPVISEVVKGIKGVSAYYPELTKVVQNIH